MILNQNLQKILSQPYPFDVVEQNKAKAIEKFGKGFVIDFGVGDPTDQTPELVRSECKKAVDARKQSGYPASLGHGQFKEAVSHWMKRRFGVSLDEEEIVATYGAKYASFHLPSYFLNPNKGEMALIPNPGYPPYSDGTILAGGNPFYLNIVPENDFQPNFEDIPKDVLEKSRLLFLNSPHSPTGKSYGKEKFQEAVDLCNDNGLVLVSDECYSELYFGKKPKSVLESKGAEECSIVLNSLSKRSMMTGYAVGFAASKNQDLLKPLSAITRKSVQGVPTFIQDAAVAAWHDQNHVEGMRKAYKERIDALMPGLEGIGCRPVKPDATFFMWVAVPDGFTPMGFSEKLLLEFGINSVPGNLLSKSFNGVNPGDRFTRFAMVASLEKTREAVERLEKWK